MTKKADSSQLEVHIYTKFPISRTIPVFMLKIWIFILFYFMLLFLLSLIHSIATRVIKLAHAKSSVALAPALVETYSRLLVYMEIESLGIKGFISKTGLSDVL